MAVRSRWCQFEHFNVVSLASIRRYDIAINDKTLIRTIDLAEELRNQGLGFNPRVSLTHGSPRTTITPPFER